MLSQLSDPLTLETMVKLVPIGGTTGLLVTLIWMLLSGKLITKREFDKLQAAHDRWQEVALRSVKSSEDQNVIVDRMAGAAEKIINRSQNER